MNYSHPALFALLALMALTPAPLPAADTITEVQASPKDFDAAIKGKLTYTYTVVAPDDIIDMDGHHFSAVTVADYLKRTKPKKKAAFLFLYSDPAHLDVVKRLIPAFSAYGAKLIAVKEMTKGGVEVPSPKPSGKGKELQIVGTANKHALTTLDPFPDLMGRPPALRPGRLPERVRYIFKPDAEVIAAAEKIEQLFLADPPVADAPGIGDILMINPGAWPHIKQRDKLPGSKPIFAQVEMNGKVQRQEGRIVFGKEPGLVIRDEVRELIHADGGGSLRAFWTPEMAFWWIYIGFDIEEPVFVLETKGGKYRFIFAFAKENLFIVDELNALPGGKSK